MMTRWISGVRRFLAGQDAPSATEYAILLALIVVFAIVAISAVGLGVSQTFNTVSAAS